MSANPESKIMWIQTSEMNVRRIFHRMKTLRNPIVQLVNYIPPELWNHMKVLEIQMKAAKNTNKNLRYIIKLGRTNLLLLTKVIGSSYWEEEDLCNYLDPQEALPESRRKRKQSPKSGPTPKRFQARIF